MRTPWILGAALMALVAPASAQSPKGVSAVDYSEAANWLCHPGRADACTADLSTTVVEADGRLTPKPFRAAQRPTFDCFYVYPTVSLDPAANSDLSPGAEEQAVIAAQFARFASVCRTFAPMYRQVTLMALRAAMSGPNPGLVPDRELAYRDVLTAWRHYMANDNRGRGVLLVGHSQGAGVLKRLLAEELDGKPAAKQIVAAYLLGTNFLVPAGAAAGGDLKQIPLCTSPDQAGCVVTYVSFRDTAPPPAASRFGRTDRPGMAVACTNPAALGSQEGAPLDAYLSTRASVASAQAAPPEWARGGKVSTPFVQVPQLLYGRCVEREGASYLQISLNAVPDDPRTDTINGDVVINGQVAADWGLHLIDINAAIGDLVSLAKRQAAAFEKTR